VRANIPQYEMIAPKTLAGVLSRLSSEAGVWRPFAGGTDLMVLFASGHLPHRKYVSLWGIPGLEKIEVTKDALILGALATYTDIANHPTVQSEFPNLAASARETGAWAIQNRGTIGGNIANASPAADTPPSLLVYDAAIELISVRGARVIPYSEFHLGYKRTALGVDEIIHRVILPRTTDTLSHYYRKVGTRKAQAISKVCFSGVLQKSGAVLNDVRIGLGSVSATPIRAKKTEVVLRGKALDRALLEQARVSLASEITPIDDIRSTAEYRQRVAQNLLEEFLGQ
jgi:CO/xanthine dehydrogenase FAD-binding subunit